MNLEIETVAGTAVGDLIEELAWLRGVVFRDWPYLYEVDAAYERRYLASYAQERAIIVTARAGGTLVGAATGMPLLCHVDNLSTALGPHFNDLSLAFYCAESVLLSEHRGQGAGHRFFDLREEHARALGFVHSVFCAVERPDDHPMRPQDYQPLNPFWMRRGYRPMDVWAKMSWPDLGEREETEKPMRFWHRGL